MKLLAPSILSADFSNLSGEIKLAELGGADIIHCDIMDGEFVPNITFGPLVVRAVNNITELPLDVHLMINKPERYINDFVDAGADYITVHAEGNIHLDKLIHQIKMAGARAGIALNPATPVSVLEHILELIDMVLIMSVNPGFGGQSFLSYTVDKLKQLDKIRKKNRFNFLIEMDGGLDSKNISRVADAGCNVFVVGSTIFNSENITASTSELKNILQKLES